MKEGIESHQNRIKI